jgi:hypothetical protein
MADSKAFPGTCQLLPLGQLPSPKVLRQRKSCRQIRSTPSGFTDCRPSAVRPPIADPSELSRGRSRQRWSHISFVADDQVTRELNVRCDR